MGGFLDEDAAHRALIAEGILSNKTLNELRDFSTIQDAVGDHYDLHEVRGGKVGLTPIKYHGESNSTASLNARLMAIDAELNGPIVSQRPGMMDNEQGPIQEPAGNKRVRKAAERILSPGAISQLASPGLRAGAIKGIDPNERLVRAINYAINLDNGYDPITGAKYIGGLDGGHVFPHAKYPQLSTASFNIQPEDKYVNRAKGNREGADLVKSLTNSLTKKLGPLKKKGQVPLSALPNLWNIGRGFD